MLNKLMIKTKIKLLNLIIMKIILIKHNNNAYTYSYKLWVLKPINQIVSNW